MKGSMINMLISLFANKPWDHLLTRVVGKLKHCTQAHTLNQQYAGTKSIVRFMIHSPCPFQANRLCVGKCYSLMQKATIPSGHLRHKRSSNLGRYLSRVNCPGLTAISLTKCRQALPCVRAREFLLWESRRIQTCSNWLSTLARLWQVTHISSKPGSFADVTC